MYLEHPVHILAIKMIKSTFLQSSSKKSTLLIDLEFGVTDGKPTKQYTGMLNIFHAHFYCECRLLDSFVRDNILLVIAKRRKRLHSFKESHITKVTNINAKPISSIDYIANITCKP